MTETCLKSLLWKPLQAPGTYFVLLEEHMLLLHFDTHISHAIEWTENTQIYVFHIQMNMHTIVHTYVFNRK